MKYLVSTLFILSAHGVVTAQGPYVRPRQADNPYARPTVSPYLNLLRPGASPAINYYGLVRPQQQFQSDIGQLDQQSSALQQGVTVDSARAALAQVCDSNG